MLAAPRIFPPRLRSALAKVSNEVTVKADDIIMDYGQIVRGIPLVLSGSIRVYRMDEDGKELLLYYVNANETCAMTFTCCMEQKPSEVKAVAEEDVVMLSIPIEYMDQWMMKYVTWKSAEHIGTVLEVLDDVGVRRVVREQEVVGGNRTLAIRVADVEATTCLA